MNIIPQKLKGQGLCHLSARLHRNWSCLNTHSYKGRCSLLVWPQGGSAGSRANRWGGKTIMQPLSSLFVIFHVSCLSLYWHIFLTHCQSCSFPRTCFNQWFHKNIRKTFFSLCLTHTHTDTHTTLWRQSFRQPSDLHCSSQSTRDRRARVRAHTHTDKHTQLPSCGVLRHPVVVKNNNE